MIGSFLLPSIIGLIFINYFLEEEIILSSYKFFIYILFISLLIKLVILFLTLKEKQN